MSRAVWKFDVAPGITRMPYGARVVAVDMQHGHARMWAEVIPENPMQNRNFHVVGTGWSIPDGYTYVGTWQAEGGDLVWHLYEVPDGHK